VEVSLLRLRVTARERRRFVMCRPFSSDVAGCRIMQAALFRIVQTHFLKILSPFPSSWLSHRLDSARLTSCMQEKKYEPPVPSRVGKRKKKSGPSAANRLPTVTPHTKCRLRLLKQERIKDYVSLAFKLLRSSFPLLPPDFAPPRIVTVVSNYLPPSYVTQWKSCIPSYLILRPGSLSIGRDRAITHPLDIPPLPFAISSIAPCPASIRRQPTPP